MNTTFDQSLPRLALANLSLAALFDALRRGLIEIDLDFKGLRPRPAILRTYSWLTGTLNALLTSFNDAPGFLRACLTSLSS